MSAARFPCERCGGSGLAASGLVCSRCNGSGFTVPEQSANDALSDWITRNTIGLVVAFVIAVWVWLGPLRRWAFGSSP